MSAPARQSSQCAVPGCGRRIVSGVLMCPGHWHMVPSALRSDLWRKLYAYDTSMLLPDVEARKRTVEAYRAAKQAAVDAVVAQLDDDDLPQPRAELRP